VRRILWLVVCLALAQAAWAVDWDSDFDDLDAEDKEEPAGSSFMFAANPVDEIYGMTLGMGVWVRNTPFFGDYFLGMFQNGIEDAFYSNFGLTIRIMPHWKLAPFVGAGGSYNYSWSSSTSASEDETEAAAEPEEDDSADRGDSYWSGHAETGFRLWIDNRLRLLEIMGRYTWSSLGSDRDYWLVGISTAAGI
jgi:hypothetical protein